MSKFKLAVMFCVAIGGVYLATDQQPTTTEDAPTENGKDNILEVVAKPITTRKSTDPQVAESPKNREPDQARDERRQGYAKNLTQASLSLLENTDDAVTAMVYLEESLRLDLSQREAIKELTKIYVDQGWSDRGIALLEDLLLHADSPEQRTPFEASLGILLADSDPQQASELLERSVSVSHDYSAAHALAKIFERENRLEDTARMLEVATSSFKARELDSNDTDSVAQFDFYRNNLLQIYLAGGYPEKARRLQREMALDNPDHALLVSDNKMTEY